MSRYPLLMLHPVTGKQWAFDGADEAKMRSAGWKEYGPPQEQHAVAVVVPPPATPPDGGPPDEIVPSDELEQLRAKAVEAGIKIDGRWGVKAFRKALGL